MSEKATEGRIWVEYRPLSELKKLAGNPKDHDIGGLHGSMNRWGYTSPITLDENTETLAAGHGRVETLEQRKIGGDPPPRRVDVDEKTGDWLVPVIRGIAFENEADLRAYAIADNRHVELGGWHDELLVKDLEMLASQDDLAGVGYDGDDLDRLIAEMDGEEATVNVTDQARWNPQERMENQYDVTPLRQIVLVMEKDEYAEALEILAQVREANDVDTNQKAVLILLRDWASRQ